MLSWRWSGAIVVAALLAGTAFLRTKRGQPDQVHAAPQPEWSASSVLTGSVQARGIDLARCQVRCSSMRPESHPTVQQAELDRQGRFEFSGLLDVDYCVELVVRSNPALVLARQEHVRPGGDGLILLADPVQVFGPAGNADR